MKLIEQNSYISTFIISFSSTVIGEHWILFVLYLLLNIIDTITGIAKARINKTENSFIGLVGTIKKLCSWLMILVAFIIPIGFQEIGNILDIDLSITIFLGWFVLASSILNEYRSILENLLEAGCHVPNILVKGLETVSKKLDEAGDKNG